MLHPVLGSIEVSQVVLQEADLPDLVVDLADVNQLLSSVTLRLILRLPRQMRPQRVTA